MNVVRGALFSVAGRLSKLSPEHDGASLPVPRQFLAALDGEISVEEQMGGALCPDGAQTGLSPIDSGTEGTVDIFTSTPS